MEKEKKNRRVVPAELLSKEFLSQFRTEDDVSSFLTDLYAQVLAGRFSATATVISNRLPYQSIKAVDCLSGGSLSRSTPIA